MARTITTSALALPAQPASMTRFLGKLDYDFGTPNPRGRAFAFMGNTSRDLINSYVIPDLRALGVTIPQRATVYDRRKGHVICQWDLEDNQGGLMVHSQGKVQVAQQSGRMQDLWIKRIEFWPLLYVVDSVRPSVKRPVLSMIDDLNTSQAKRHRHASGISKVRSGQDAQGQPPKVPTTSASTDAPGMAIVSVPYDGRARHLPTRSLSPSTSTVAAALSFAPSSDIVRPGASRDIPWSRTSESRKYVPKPGQSLGSDKEANASRPQRHHVAGSGSQVQKAVNSSVTASSGVSVPAPRRRAPSGSQKVRPPPTSERTVENVYTAAGLPCSHDACSHLARNLATSNNRLVDLVRELDTSRKEAARASNLEAKVACEYTIRERLEARIEHGKRVFNTRGDALLARDAVIAEKDAIICGLTATVERLSAKGHVLIREIQELAPEGYDLDRLGRLMRV